MVQLFGLMPWQLDDLTPAELDAIEKLAEDAAHESQRAARAR